MVGVTVCQDGRQMFAFRNSVEGGTDGGLKLEAAGVSGLCQMPSSAVLHMSKTTCWIRINLDRNLLEIEV